MRSHAHWEDEAAAYALRSLEEQERQAFERHLAECPRCQEDVAAMSETLQTLPERSPTEPSGDLKRRVIRAVQAEAGESGRRARGPLLPALGLAAAAGAAAVVVLATGGGSSTRTYLGQVAVPGASASLSVSGQRGRLRLTDLPAPPAGRLYEVWLKRGGQAPAPSGTLFATGNGSVAVAGSLSGVREVLVTAEPRPRGSRVPTRPPIIVVRLVRS